MDKHISNDPQNPINYAPTPQEERDNELNQLLQDRLHELCEKYLNDDPFQYLDESFVEDIHEYTAQEIEEELLDNGFFNVEIIYYSNAIEYLKENDSSFSESLEIAYELGYETQHLNSELLASLHASRKKEDDFNEFVYPELEKITK